MHAYVTLDQVKAQLQLTGTGNDATLSRVIVSASEAIDNLCARSFQPMTRTRVLATTGGRWNALPDLLSVDTITLADGTTVDADAYVLDAGLGDGIGANGIWLDAAPVASHDGLTITGRWGYRDERFDVGTLGAAIVSASATTLTMAAGHTVQVGHTLRIGDEDMYVRGVATNAVTVRRGQNGTTATTHSNGATVAVYEYPYIVTEAALLQAVRLWRRADAPFGVTGSSEVGQMTTITRIDPDVVLLLWPVRRFVAAGSAVPV